MNDFIIVETRLAAVLKMLSTVAIICTLVLPWKYESNCSDSYLTLTDDGYDHFIPKHNQSLYRGYAVLALLLLAPSCWLRVNLSLVFILGAAWFLFNEAVLHLAAVRCPGSDEGSVGPGIFTAYSSIVFAVLSVFKRFKPDPNNA